jgi:hypothetical protein
MIQIKPSALCFLSKLFSLSRRFKNSGPYQLDFDKRLLPKYNIEAGSLG